MFLSRKNVELMRARYPQGTRLELISMEGENDMPKGLKGTVDFIDDSGQILMTWDNGRTLALNPEIDHYRKITQPEEIQDIQKMGGMHL